MTKMEKNDPYGRRDQFADVKERLAEWLEDEGEPGGINERVWNYLLDKPALLRAVRSRPESELVRLYQEYKVTLHHFGPRAPRRKKEVELPGDARSQALAAIAANAAERFVIGIDSFRQQQLGGRLLEPGKIPAWIEAQRQREGAPAASYVRVPQMSYEPPPRPTEEQRTAPYAAWLRREAERVAANADAELPAQEIVGPWTLSCAAPGERTSIVTIRGDGVLAQLRALVCEGSALQQYTGWPEAQAVAFVLSGHVPAQRLAVARASYTEGAYPALSRIGLEVDPRLSAAEVGRLYQELRSEFVRGRDRPMYEKHLALAVFTEETRDSGESWSTLRTRWNALHPRWRFKVADDVHAKRFALECRTAWSRVTGEAWRSESTRRQASKETPRRPARAPKEGGQP